MVIANLVPFSLLTGSIYQPNRFATIRSKLERLADTYKGEPYFFCQVNTNKDRITAALNRVLDIKRFAVSVTTPGCRKGQAGKLRWPGAKPRSIPKLAPIWTIPPG
jgi:hypothetical protein